MLGKLLKQSAIYGVSTILGRLLSYLLTPYYTRVFVPEEYGIITDVYALIPFALVILTLGMESSYFRFTAKAEEAGGDKQSIAKAKDKIFRTTWGTTVVASLLFLASVFIFRQEASAIMGEVYTQQPYYILIVAAIILYDVISAMPFARLRERGEARKYVLFKLINIILQVAFAFAFGFMGLYSTSFGVGWALVANLLASIITFAIIKCSTLWMVIPIIDTKILRSILIYSFPLLLSGIAATATDFIDRQMIKHIISDGAMAQLGIYGAVTKIAVVMTLFTQMYRLAAEPFFLSNFKKEEFVEMNAAAMKYYIIFTTLIFLGIALFKDLFSLIVGQDYREGVYILPVVLSANLLMGVWLNLSFWYKREEKTWLAIFITFIGLIAAIIFNLIFIPHWGYFGAAWARLLGQITMVIVSYVLLMRFYPIPYDLRRMAEYVALAVAIYFIDGFVYRHVDIALIHYTISALLIFGYVLYTIRREKINLKAMISSIIHRG